MDLPVTVKFKFHPLFADDFQLYKHVTTVDIRLYISRIKDDLRYVINWAIQDQLTLNEL